MKRERNLLLLGLGLAAAATQPAVATSPPASAALDPSEPIQRLANIRADYLKALIDRRLYDPDMVIAQQPKFSNFPNFKNWANGWRNF